MAEQTSTSVAIMGASVIGGVPGILFVGPLVGVAAAGGAAYMGATGRGNGTAMMAVPQKWWEVS
jgi:hypothetical protein